MSEKFPGHGIVGPTGGPGSAAPTQLVGENIRAEKISENGPPKILTLLDAFDEILTLLGPCSHIMGAILMKLVLFLKENVSRLNIFQKIVIPYLKIDH